MKRHAVSDALTAKRPHTTETQGQPCDAVENWRSGVTHSGEEIELLCRVMRGLESDAVTTQVVVKALLDGDEDAKWDSVYTLSCGVSIKMDYDGKYYHEMARLRKDVLKTAEALTSIRQGRTSHPRQDKWVCRVARS